jgi:hypothetical protein
MKIFLKIINALSGASQWFCAGCPPGLLLSTGQAKPASELVYGNVTGSAEIQCFKEIKQSFSYFGFADIGLRFAQFLRERGLTESGFLANGAQQSAKAVIFG